MSIPSFTRNYWTQSNQPFASTTTAGAMFQSALFILKQSLINSASGGTTSGTRVSTSNWTVLGSSNSTTAALDATDRWTTYTNIVQANNGTAHSWIVLRNSTLGYDLLLDANSSTTTTGRIAVAPSSTTFTGGSTTAGPTSTAEIDLLSTSTGASINAAIFPDTTTAGACYGHFITADNGEFLYLTSRSGLGIFTSFIGVQKTTGGDTDPNNLFIITDSVTTGRGSPRYSVMGVNAVNAISKSPSGSQVTTGGLSANAWGGAAYPTTYGASGVSSNFIVDPIRVRSLVPQVAERGVLQDIYWIGNAIVGGSYPSTGAQTHVIAGDIVIPFPSVNPSV